MPIFEYKCDCNHITEKIQRKHVKVTDCEKCNGDAHYIPSATTDDGYRFSSHDRAVVGDNWICPSRREALKNQ